MHEWSVQLRVVEFLIAMTIFGRVARLTEAIHVRMPGLHARSCYSASVRVASHKHGKNHLTLEFDNRSFHACNWSWTLLRCLQRLMHPWRSTSVAVITMEDKKASMQALLANTIDTDFGSVFQILHTPFTSWHAAKTN